MRKRITRLGLLAVIILFAYTAYVVSAPTPEAPITVIREDAGPSTAPVMEEPAIIRTLYFNAPDRERMDRYAGVYLDPDLFDLVARLCKLEDEQGGMVGMQAVAEVVFNRVIHPDFPDDIRGVIYQEGQFACADKLEDCEPTQEAYNAVMSAWYGPYLTEPDVVFFGLQPENSRVYAKLGSHWYCREYQWE